MALITVATRNDLLNELNLVRDTDDTIQVAPGVYLEWCYPRNNNRPVAIRAASISNPPVMRGVALGQNVKGNIDVMTRGEPKGSTFQGVTFDGIRFYAKRLRAVKKSPTDNSPTPTPGPDGSGYGWRIDYTYPNVVNIGQGQGNQYGLQLNGSMTDTLIQNCYFNGFSRAISGAGLRTTIMHNEFDENCEDLIYVNGGTDCYYGYNYLHDPRPMSMAEAQAAYSWADSAPPHMDAFQFTAQTIRALVEGCVIIDPSERMHGMLIKLAADTNQTRKHIGLIVRDIYIGTNHSSCLWVNDADRPTITRIKIWRNGNFGSANDPSLQVGFEGKTTTAASRAANVILPTLDNLYVNKMGPTPGGDQMPGAWTITNLTVANNENTLPPGMPEVRPYKRTSSGQRLAGPYEQGGTVVLPTKPVALIAGQVEFNQLEQEPSLPPEDVRRSFSARVPQHKTIRFSGGNATIPAGTTINDATSGATAVTAAEPVVESGTYGGSDAVGYIPVTSWTGTWAATHNLRVGTTVRGVVTKAPMLSPAFGAAALRWNCLAEGTVTRAMFKQDALGPNGEEIWQATSNVDPRTTTTAPHLRYPGESFQAPKFLYQLTEGGERSDLSPALADIVVPATPGEQVWRPTQIIDFNGAKQVLGIYVSDENGDILPMGLEFVLESGSKWSKPAPVKVGSGNNSSFGTSAPNSPTAYSAGALLMAICYRQSNNPITPPSTAFLTETVNVHDGGNGQSMSIVQGIVAAANTPIGSFSAAISGGAPRNITLSFADVEPTDPAIWGTPADNASAATIAVPGLTIPPENDCYRVGIVACNVNGRAITVPDGFELFKSNGSTPRIDCLISLEPMASFGGLTLEMTGGYSASIAVPFALQLKGSIPS